MKLKLTHLIHSEDADPFPAEPLCKLSSPVLHEAPGSNHKDTFRNRPPSVRALPEQRPAQRHALQGLPEAHLISQDGAVTTYSSEAHDALKLLIKGNDDIPRVQEEIW